MSSSAGTAGFSSNVEQLRPSATIAVSSRARELRDQGRDIINLGAGEPDFPTPSFIAEAGITAIREGKTRYTPAPGLPELRQAVADSMARRHGRDVDHRGVVVSAGAKQALFNALFVLTGPGDRVLVPVHGQTRREISRQGSERKIARSRPVHRFRPGRFPSYRRLGHRRK
ncbi:MAG TPA: aminotransferase class I/II-fold pyridoxal phosphate-dependent enzyme, partial [Longimicrobiales bacterium]|nr:aminotransferase class I/II-fold pyridoxal phosphate-dependent enzyme [Longimicrobiales bacterium]